VTQEDLVAWLKTYFFNLSDQNITNILATYPSSSSPVNPNDPRYETDGYGPGTAVNISQAATGQQQRAYVSAGLEIAGPELGQLNSPARTSMPRPQGAATANGWRPLSPDQVAQHGCTSTQCHSRLTVQTLQVIGAHQLTTKGLTLSQPFEVCFPSATSDGGAYP